MALAHAHVEPLLTRGERLRLARERSGLRRDPVGLAAAMEGRRYLAAS